VLDAENLDAEPLATLSLPLRLRNGLHGTWLTGEELVAYESRAGA
jgi:carotenoid cleavage dioxygenase